MRTREKISKNDLLQALIDVNLPTDDLLGEAVVFLVAGHETTSCTLEWIVYNLCKHPEVEEKMVREIVSVLGDRENITVQDLEKLQFVECVINETLRINPPVVANGRTSTQDVVLNNLQFPKNIPFFFSTWAIHHDPEIWPNADKFDPSRWENNFAPPAGTFLPFGYGPRMCIGAKFSILETKTVIAQLYRKFTFTLESSEKNIQPLIRDIVTHPRELKVSAKKRAN